MDLLYSLTPAFSFASESFLIANADSQTLKSLSTATVIIRLADMPLQPTLATVSDS